MRFLSVLILWVSISSQNSQLNINQIPEIFNSPTAKGALFGASIALHGDGIHVGAPNNNGVFRCSKGSSCNKVNGFSSVSEKSMLGMSVDATKNKIITCAPRTNNVKNYGQQMGMLL